ncbi:MAG TPA: hypothetical protein VH138_00530 [Vicinamibacterales bacterium]|jgi:hypothetical protein|nr:hypothetical protein [Vicinamibacterales bacterium]
MKTLIVWALLVGIPASSLRIVCVSSAEASGDDSAGTPADIACQTICVKQGQAPQATRCLLVEDLSCAYAVGMPIAVLPPTVTMSFVRTAERFETAVPATYDVPTLDRAGPPPKA